MNNIGILGCGWIGIPLSKLLIKKGYSIKGTATSIEKTQSLLKLGIKSYCYYLNNKDSLFLALNNKEKVCFLYDKQIKCCDVA